MRANANRLLAAVLPPETNIGKALRVAKRRFQFARLERAAQHKTHRISPDDIRFVSRRKFPIDRGIGKVLDGDWDDLNLSIEQLDFYQAFVTVSRNGQAWSETPFFQRVLSEIKSGYESWGCRTEDEFRARLQALENSYRQISELGYIVNDNGDQVSVSVNIGRHGDLLLNDEPHWLTFAKLLDLPYIPITIAVRHRQWDEFKREILKHVLRTHKIYTPVLHPDLEWIPSRYGHKRFELIQRALVSQSGTMLDIGSNWGYFCHRFEEMGFECIGVDANSANCYFSEKLKRARNRKFQIVNASIFDYVGQERRQFDVVLALSIFHHFIKSESNYHQLKNLLANLHTREMYFMPHDPLEPQMRNAYWNPSEDEFVAFILEHSDLVQATCCGHADWKYKRALYQLTIWTMSH